MFYTIIIKSDSQAIFSFDNQDSAMEKLHSEMAYAYNQKVETSVLVTDKFFSMIKKDVFVLPAEEVSE